MKKSDIRIPLWLYYTKHEIFESILSNVLFLIGGYILSLSYPYGITIGTIISIFGFYLVLRVLHSAGKNYSVMKNDVQHLIKCTLDNQKHNIETLQIISKIQGSIIEEKKGQIENMFGEIKNLIEKTKNKPQ